MSGARNYLHFLRAVKLTVRPVIQIDDLSVFAADDQKSRRANAPEQWAGQIRSTATRNHCSDVLRMASRRDQSCAGSGAGAEIGDRQSTGFLVFREPASGLGQTRRQHLYIKS